MHRLAAIHGGDIEVQFDESKPEGQPRRACDTTKAAEKVGFRATVSLDDGLQQTVEWFLRHGRRERGA